MSALKLIGTHMDEDENLARALSEHLGMTAEEMRECGVETSDVPEQDVRKRFEQKINTAYEDYKVSWLHKTSAELVEDAAEIASIQRMIRELPATATEEDMAYLLRFKNPLEVVSDAWRFEVAPVTNYNDDLSHALWELKDKQGAEADYEMEPEYYDTGPNITM